MASLKEETDDLTTCSICMESYNEKRRKPKSLPCSHTFCSLCTKKMVDQPPPDELKCPVCNEFFRVPKGIEGLPTNRFALHIMKLNKTNMEVIKTNMELINTTVELNNANVKLDALNMELNNILTNGQPWCETCNSPAKAVCHQTEHKVTNFNKDVEEFDNWLTGAGIEVAKVEGSRDQGRNDLLSKNEKQKQTNSKTVNALLGEMQNGKKKLGLLMTTIKELKLLPASLKTSVFTHKNLRQVITDVQQEAMKTDEFLKRVANVPINQENKEIVIQLNEESNSAFTADDATLTESSEIKQINGDLEEISFFSRKSTVFAANCFAVGRQEVGPSKAFSLRELISRAGFIRAMEFSDDGSFLSTGGWDGIVRLWPLDKVAKSGENPVEIEMKKRHVQNITCLANSPDNNRLFSCGLDGRILKHDVQTTKLLYSIVTDNMLVYSISLQPGSDGKVFAVGCDENIFCIYDTRCAAIQCSCYSALSAAFKQPGRGLLNSIMFSPANPSIVAVSGPGAVHLRDIRQRRFKTLNCCSFENAVSCAKFDVKGTRLLCGSPRLPIVVYNNPYKEQQPNEMPGKVQLRAQKYSPAQGNACCFVGQQDELVAGASADNSLHIWSAPEGEGNRIIDQSLLSLNGHRQSIDNVRFCKATSTLASSGSAGIIQLWTATNL